MRAAAALPSVTVTVARSVDEVEELRPLWKRLQGRELPSDIDYFLCVARHNPDVVRPHVVAVQPERGEPSLLATHLSETRVPHRLGAWNPYAPHMRVLNFFRGVVGAPTPGELELALRTLQSELGSQVDAILLRNLVVPSTLHETALRVFPSRSRQRWLVRRARWEADIGVNPDGALEALSASTQGNVRRTARRLQKVFGDELRTVILREPAEAQRVFDDIDAVALRTYQTKLRPIFRDDALERELALLGLEKGWFRAYLLYIGDRPVSFWTGFGYAGTFGWRGATGYDPEFRSFGMGKFLLASMLDDLAQDETIVRFSLGAGDLPYKRQFGDRGHEEVDIRIFASRPRAMWVNRAGSAVLGVHAAFRAARALPTVGHRVEAQHERLKHRRRKTPARRPRTSEHGRPPD